MTKFRIAAVALISLSAMAQTCMAQTRQADQHEVNPYGQEHASSRNDGHGPINMTAYQDARNGVFSLDNGTCIKRTVYDNGYTYVTIDAQGTLAPIKNDVVENVAIACP